MEKAGLRFRMAAVTAVIAKPRIANGLILVNDRPAGIIHIKDLSEEGCV